MVTARAHRGGVLVWSPNVEDSRDLAYALNLGTWCIATPSDATGNRLRDLLRGKYWVVAILQIRFFPHPELVAGIIRSMAPSCLILCVDRRKRADLEAATWADAGIRGEPSRYEVLEATRALARTRPRRRTAPLPLTAAGRAGQEKTS